MRRVVSWVLAVVFGAWMIGMPAGAQAGQFGFSIGQDLGAIDVVGGHGVTNLGTRIGYRLNRLVLFACADYGRYSLKRDFESPDFSTIKRSGSLVTAGLGGRYLFEDPEPDSVVPYVVATGFTVIPNTSSTEEDTTEGASYRSFGFLGGFGADYFFGKNFSIGGELGFDALFARYANSDEAINASVMQIYSAVEFTFYL